MKGKRKHVVIKDEGQSHIWNSQKHTNNSVGSVGIQEEWQSSLPAQSQLISQINIGTKVFIEAAVDYTWTT